MPGVLEAGGFVVNTLIGIWSTIAKQKMDARAAEHQQMLAIAERQSKSNAEARSHEEAMAEGTRRIRIVRKLFGKEFSYEKQEDGFVSKQNGGFHITRRVIALTIVFAYFLWPVLAVAFVPDVSFAYGYPETVSGFFGGDRMEVKWFILGNGDRTIFYPPFVSLTLSCIMGVFFGNQITKR